MFKWSGIVLGVALQCRPIQALFSITFIFWIPVCDSKNKQAGKPRGGPHVSKKTHCNIYRVLFQLKLRMGPGDSEGYWRWAQPINCQIGRVCPSETTSHQVGH